MSDLLNKKFVPCEGEVSAFDLGNNQSEVEIVEISPLDAPIHDILRSIDGRQDFGGINISYENPSGANVSLNMSVLNDSGELEFKESFYTSQKNSSSTQDLNTQVQELEAGSKKEEEKEVPRYVKVTIDHIPNGLSWL